MMAVGHILKWCLLKRLPSLKATTPLAVIIKMILQVSSNEVYNVGLSIHMGLLLLFSSARYSMPECR